MWCNCADTASATNREIFGWPAAVYPVEASCPATMIMPVSVNGDLSVGYIDQAAVPCTTASNYNNNQQQQQHGYNSGYVLAEMAQLHTHPQPQPLPSIASVQRIARPILGAAVNLGLPHESMDKTGTSNMPNDSSAGKAVVGTAVPITLDLMSQPARPPSNSDNIPNGRHWPPSLDSPNYLRSISVLPPSSSPALMQQPTPSDVATANASHQFLPPAYCFMTPAAVPSTTVPTDTTVPVSSAVVQPVPSASLCTAGCCHCGQCQPTVPPVGAYAYTYPPFMIPSAAPFLPGFGYTIPGVPFPPPSLPPGSYTQSSELVYNNQAVFTLMHQYQRLPPPAQPPPPPNTGRALPLKHSPVVTVPFNPLMPPPSTHVVNPSGGRQNSSKNLSCFNCGLIGHQASVCPEPLISASAHTGTSLLPVVVCL